MKDVEEVLAIEWISVAVRAPHHVGIQWDRESRIAVKETKQEQIARQCFNCKGEFAPVFILSGTRTQAEFGFPFNEMPCELFNRFR
jgi:hypothetical protein